MTLPDGFSGTFADGMENAGRHSKAARRELPS
jgi:hypothetical protein